jgi:Lrp/AsnC family transcriptional regulator, leucine-responsive regulatory protein
MPKNTAQIENFTNAYITDDKDLAILRLLQQNAKATIQEISKTVNLSTTPVHERIKRLEATGVIKQYATLIDVTKVNKSLTVICYVSLKEHNKNAGVKFIQSILAMNDVVECFSISGEFDFMLKVVAADMDSYYNFHVNKLSQADNVGHIQSVFVMGVVKDTHVRI